MSYARVLLATDLSEPAAQAARLARRLAAPGAATRAVLVQPPALARAGKDDAAQAELRAWLDWHQMVDVEALVAAGPAARELGAQAAAMGADLLALGAQGESMMERVLLGSTARGALRHARCDTLVARGHREIRRVLVATDFSQPAARAVHRAALVAERLGAQVHLLHVLDPGLAAAAMRDETQHGGPEEELRALNRQAFGGKAIARVSRGRPGAEIPRVAVEVEADLVVVGDHGAGAFERAMLGSVAEVVAERAASSVLVVRGAVVD
jgi:nucleotide-binding universal stress UspA family protein